VTRAAPTCNPIGGATSSSYSLGAADVGSTLTVTVTATNTAGSNAASSSATGVVGSSSSPPVNTAAPTISGTTTQGQTMSATTGSWTGNPAPTFAYQWSRCDQAGVNCSQIAGATSASYTLVSADVSLRVRVIVTATNSAGSAQASSALSAVVTAPPANTAAPAISGTTTEAQTLSASTGSWTGYPAPTFAYQWNRCDQAGGNCNAIAGATSSSYTQLSADVGSTLRVTVTASNTAGSAPATSNATTKVSSAAGPVTPLLDDFNRANNTGPPGANWTHMAVGSGKATNNLFISEAQAAAKSGANADYWNPQAFGPNSEAWVTVVTKPTQNDDPVVLSLRLQNPAASTASGYFADYTFSAKEKDKYHIKVRTNGAVAATIATANNGPSLVAGDRLLFRAIGSTLELWRFTGSSWTLLLTATDTTYPAAGYLGLAASDEQVRLDNFGGGTLP